MGGPRASLVSGLRAPWPPRDACGLRQRPCCRDERPSHAIRVGRGRHAPCICSACRCGTASTVDNRPPRFVGVHPQPPSCAAVGRQSVRNLQGKQRGDGATRIGYRPSRDGTGRRLLRARTAASAPASKRRRTPSAPRSSTGLLGWAGDAGNGTHRVDEGGAGAAEHRHEVRGEDRVVRRVLACEPHPTTAHDRADVSVQGRR